MVIKTKAIKITRSDDKQKVKTNLTTIIENTIYMHQDNIFYQVDYIFIFIEQLQK